MMADAVRVGRRREGAALSHPQNRHEAEGGGQPLQTYHTWFLGPGARWALWGNPWGQGVAG